MMEEQFRLLSFVIPAEAGIQRRSILGSYGHQLWQTVSPAHSAVHLLPAGGARLLLPEGNSVLVRADFFRFIRAEGT